MKLLLESHVPYVPQEIHNIFDVTVMPPEDINPQSIKDFDAIIIRTRTRCNAELLAGSRVQFVSTATIGMDHIDIPWCNANGIEVASAPGCNAPAVAQYVFASLLALYPDGLKGKTLGVVGVGNVGRIVADWGERLGMSVLRCDPPRAEREGAEGFVTLDEIAAQSDIVTFHVPHTRDGRHATHHIANADFYNKLRKGVTLVNAARGPIVDTPALIEAIDRGIVGKAVIDTWEGEPRLSLELLKRAAIATPHIAGYSLQGKIRAATAVTNALCRHFGVDYVYDPGLPYLPAEVTESALRASYDPMADDRILRATPERFEILRDTYPLRNELGITPKQ